MSFVWQDRKKKTSGERLAGGCLDVMPLAGPGRNVPAYWPPKAVFRRSSWAWTEFSLLACGAASAGR